MNTQGTAEGLSLSSARSGGSPREDQGDGLKAGVLLNGVVVRTQEGTPQGGPLSPLLANIYLDDLDKELEKRGHRFVRYADDCNIYVQSRRAAERVMQSIRDFLQKRLKLKVNEEKSSVDRRKRKIVPTLQTGGDLDKL